MKQLLKRVALLFAVGGFCGDVVAMASGPRAIAWLNTPALGKALCECEAVTQETAAAIIRLQLIFTAAGGVLFVVVGLVGRVLWRRRTQAAGLALVSAPSSKVRDSDG